MVGTAAEGGGKTKPNEPCHCGSGKKFKKVSRGGQGGNTAYIGFEQVEQVDWVWLWFVVCSV